MRYKGFFRISSLVIISILLITYSCKKSSRLDITPGETVTDIDGKVYHTVKIGTQVWMVENLNVSRYSNGDAIPEVDDAASWKTLANGAWCNHNNDPGFTATYGRLYNWYAVNDDRKIAPQGWHVATDSEWTILINYLEDISKAGGKLKESGTAHWPAPNTGASNVSGFTALPGGYRNDFGEFSTIAGGYWWSSTKYTESALSGAWSRSLSFISEGVTRYDAIPTYGQSIRCVKD